MSQASTTKKRLDIGCGNNKIPGSTYVDFDPKANPDILHDLNKFPYPIADDSFDEIYAKHIIEHLDDPIGFMKEMARILKPGGTIFVETPHFSSRVAYSEPQHTLFFSYFITAGYWNGRCFIFVCSLYDCFFRGGLAFVVNSYYFGLTSCSIKLSIFSKRLSKKESDHLFGSR